jgi:phospholipase C
VIISPYAKKNFVSHVQYEHGSILKFTEDQFGLPRIAASDTRANSPEDDCFDFTQQPRQFQQIGSSYSRAFFEHQKPSYLPVDSE